MKNEADPGRVEIQLTNGGVTYVSPEDFEFVSQFSWHREKNKHTYYARASIGGKQIRLHRLIAHAEPGQMVDHKDGDGLNNTRENIRVVTHTQNNWNRRKFGETASRYLGVVPNYGGSKDRPWLVRFFHEGKAIRCGTYATEIEAAEAYNKLIVTYRGEYARLNEITEDKWQEDESQDRESSTTCEAIRTKDEDTQSSLNRQKVARCRRMISVRSHSKSGAA